MPLQQEKSVVGVVTVFAQSWVQFKLPGSHGIIYPWSPRVGLDVEVLEVLEDALWRELLPAVKEQQLISSTHQSSGSSALVERDTHFFPSKLNII